MPPSVKPWQNYGSASTPIDSPGLIGLEYRTSNYVGSSELGVGVGGQRDFRATQAGAGSLTLNVGTPGISMRAVLPGDGNGGTQRYDYNGAQLTATIGAANATNPRIDMVTLAGGSTIDDPNPQVIVVPGVASAGATLDNRTGAAVLPAGRILLADVLVAANATQILTAAIRDRRDFFSAGVVPVPNQQSDSMILESLGGIFSGLQTVTAGTNDNRTSMMSVWLPRRTPLNTIKWRFRTGATAPATTYTIWLADASGRLIGSAAGTFSTGSNTSNTVGLSITLLNNQALIREAGQMYVGWTVATMGAGSTIQFLGFQGFPQTGVTPGCAMQNLYFAGTGVTLTPSMNFAGTLADAATTTVDVVTLATPQFVLGG